MTDITQADIDLGKVIAFTIEEERITEAIARYREAAFLAGVKAMQEAAAADIETWFPGNSLGRSAAAQSLLRSIRAIDPTSIKDTQP